MTACEQFIESLERKLPELCRTRDLVKIGIVQSGASACQQRQKGTGPEFFELNGRFLYPKKGVIDYLRKSARSGSEL